MNRTIKDATVKHYFYETHDQLRAHLRDFFARRLKTLRHGGKEDPSDDRESTEHSHRHG